MFSVPVPTFVLGPNKEDHVSHYPDLKGCELCNNVTYLGKSANSTIWHVWPNVCVAVCLTGCHKHI